MAITENRTLPDEWKSDITYMYGDMVLYLNNKAIYQSISQNDPLNPNLNKIPPDNPEFWLPLDIYKKDESRMPHGHYSGEESMWEKDNFVITPAGYVLINGENTGINVRGPGGEQVVHWEDLTALQREALRGPQGLPGEQGAQGEQGEQGEPGVVEWDNLTPEQIEQLRGAQGKSNYDIWLEQGHTGDEQDYLFWLRDSGFKVDSVLSTVSINPVENRAIAYEWERYRAKVNDVISQLERRISHLESRLSAVYNNETHIFTFGVTPEGQYGYCPTGTTNVIPFNEGDTTVLSTIFANEMLGVAAQDIGLHDSLVADTIANLDPYRPTSLLGSPSRTIKEDTNQIYGTDVDAIDLETYIDLNLRYTDIYANGDFKESNPAYSYGVDGMNIKTTCIQSKGQQRVEGMYFNSIGDVTQKVLFEIKPNTTGEVISFQIGALSNTVNNLDNVRNFINALDNNPNTDPAPYGIIGYKQGTISELSTVYIEVPFECGCYIVTRVQDSFKIMNISYL